MPAETEKTKDNESLASLDLATLMTLDVVLVTAGKQGAEPLHDVPVSITAIDQEKIERSGMDNFLSYAGVVPGLGFQMYSPAGGRDDIRSGRRLNLRGIESGYDGVPTVAFYLDEAPVPVMDPKLFDIERIEVLRGPQGSLYGANSMGGAIRVVTNKPVLDKAQYRSDAILKSTRFGDPSYAVNGMLNIPVVERELAVRGVVFYRNEGGVIDNVLSGDAGTPQHVDRDIDGEESWGARLAASWQPTADLRITPSVFHQQTQLDATSTWDGAFRELSVLDRGVADRQDNTFTLYGLESGWELGRFKLISATAYFKADFDTIEDLTKGYFNAGLLETGQLQLSLVQTQTTRFSEELRISYAGTRWNGVAGVFYLDEDRRFKQRYPRADGSSEPEIFNGTQRNGEQQLALFSESTFKLTERFALTAGARWFRGDQDQHVRFFSDGIPDEKDGGASEAAISPKIQLSFRLDPDRMGYVSATKGFRPGGPNASVPLSSCAADLATLGLAAAPQEFNSDQLWSYELGSKLAFANRRATVDTSIYYIDWRDVQQTLLLINCGFTFLGNVGAARSKGFEVEFAMKPTERLSLTGSVGSTDAQFTKSNPDIGILSGDRLPLVPRWTASASAQYSFTLPRGRAAYVLGDYQFHDRTFNGFVSDELQSFRTVNTRLSVALSEKAELTLFIDNLTDERPQLYFFTNTDPGLLPAERREDIITARPRTIGITFRYGHLGRP